MIKLINICLLFFGVLIIVGCEKKLFDYRNKYLGDWEFTVERHQFNIDSVGHNFTDIITYDGEIKYGQDDDEIEIEYTDENSITVTVDKEGEIGGLGPYGGGEFDGKKEINFRFKLGGNGSFTEYTVEGEKD